jgi:hypothetical protein
MVAAAFICVLSWASRAQATDGFPKEIEGHLMLPSGSISKIAPPDGCHLCHVNGSAGGDPLTSFGTTMKASGGVKNVNTSVDGALDVIQGRVPKWIDDLKNGTDPNSDTDAGTDVNVDPVPQYGCGYLSVSGREPEGGWSVLVVAAVTMASGLRRRKRRS